MSVIMMRRASSLPGLKDRGDGRGERSWVALARAHAPQYAGLLVLLLLLAASEAWHPFRRNLYVGETPDLELWRYSYPLKANHVPAWAVPCVAVSVPCALIAAWLLAGRMSRAEAHAALLVVLYCVATTGTLTNWVKCEVGRPRPHMVSRCWPNGAKPVFSPEGHPICSDAAVNPEEGIKSFPSGHTSWSTSGLGWATFFLLGKLRCFDGQAQPLRFLAALTPLLGAVWIGLSRIQDNWHHETDVMAGFGLGLAMAFCFYRQLYAPIMSPQAGMLTVAVRPPPPARASSSRLQLLQGEALALPEDSGDDKV